MKYILDGREYNVIITRKNNKNTYIKVKKDLNIYVSTSYFVTNNSIKKMLDENKTYLRNCVNEVNTLKEKENTFYYLGKSYDIILLDSDINIIDNRIYVKSYEYLNKWLNKKTKEIFKERYEFIYNLFEENIPCPRMRIRHMKTRWGVCNKKSNTITINSELIKYDIEKLDYVIIHEFSHLIHFNHSKDFWSLVSKYCPRYKEIRKELRG